MADPAVLIQQLQLLIGSPEAFSGDNAQRQEIRQLGRRAAEALESPFETIQRVVYAPLPLVAARIAQDKHIFATLAESEDGVTLDELRGVSQLEGGVLEFIMDYLCSQAMCAQAGLGRYAATGKTDQFLTPFFSDAITHFHDNCLPGFAALYKTLGDGNANLTAFQVGHRTDEDFYTWMESHPPQQGAFYRFMEASFASLPTWLDVLPFESDLTTGASRKDVVLVDVGGGNGSQCAALKARLPDLVRRVVLQDRPDVLAKALELQGVEKMAYDFLTEQPLQGARAYYLRQIMHNHDDDTCIRILKSQMPAMSVRSVILIDEKVLPDDKPVAGSPESEYTAALSLAMKVMFNAQERRESHCRKLVDRAGLVIKDIRRLSKFDDAIIILARAA